MRAVGLQVDELFDKFCDGASTATEAYGTEGFHIDRELVEGWRLQLRKHFGLQDQDRAVGVKLRDSLHYDSPVDSELLRAGGPGQGPRPVCLRLAGRRGPPQNQQADRHDTVGIFPPKADSNAEEEAEELALQTAWKELRNYGSYQDELAEAEEETARLVGKGLVKRVDLDHVERYFGQPRLSKLGLIVKVKESGQKKRRIIVDALHWGVNGKAVCPERIVLPRPDDMHATILDMKAQEPQLLKLCNCISPAADRPSSSWRSSLDTRRLRSRCVASRHCWGAYWPASSTRRSCRCPPTSTTRCSVWWVRAGARRGTPVWHSSP